MESNHQHIISRKEINLMPDLKRQKQVRIRSGGNSLLRLYLKTRRSKTSGIKL